MVEKYLFFNFIIDYDVSSTVIISFYHIPMKSFCSVIIYLICLIVVTFASRSFIREHSNTVLAEIKWHEFGNQ